MGELSWEAFGQRIRRVREQSGKSQKDVAHELGIDRSAYTKVERGMRKLTALELSDLARILEVRMSVLTEDAAPAVIAYRSRTGLDVVDSRVDQLLDELVRDVRLVQSIVPARLDVPDSVRQPFTLPRTGEDAEALAGQARELLDVPEDQPIRDLAEQVARIGMWVFADDLGPDNADAGTVMLERGGVTLVNSHRKVGARRFALAHELGHYLVQDDYTVDWRVSSTVSDASVESMFDRFARAVLLPAKGLAERWKQELENSDVRTAAVLVASHYQVDMNTLARRLGDLDLAPTEVRGVVRETVTTRVDIIDHGLVVPYEMHGRFVCLAFQRAVIEAYRRSGISAERAVSLLRGSLSVDDLPDLPRLHRDETWKFVS